MTKTVFHLAAAFYWVLMVLSVLDWNGMSARFQRLVPLLERTAICVYTLALALYISKLQVVDGAVLSEQYDRPASWLLFAWSIAAAYLSSHVIYGHRIGATFAHLAVACAITFSPGTGSIFQSVFTNDLQWLSFHRLCFLIGYAFCLLALPMVVRYVGLILRGKWRGHKMLTGDDERMLWRLDRMAYRNVLWALPLLTAGIVIEALVLLESNRLPNPEEIWHQQIETLLAIATWFLCGLYLHMRLFFGWRYVRSALLYFAGFLLIFAGHIYHSINK